MNLTTRTLIVLALAAAACGKSPDQQSTDGGPGSIDAGSQTPSDGGAPVAVTGTAPALNCSSPPATTAQVGEVVTGNTQFAVNMFGQLTASSNGNNVFYSPLSVSTALAMTYLGANGTTASQLATALQFPSLSNQDLAAAFGTLSCELTTDGQAVKGAQLDLANAVFGQVGASFQTPFLNLLQADLGAPLLSLDFQANADGSRQAINQWVSEHTDSMIPQLLGPGTVQSDTRMVLADALYFDQQWSTPFDPSSTQPASFAVSSTQSVMVPTMSGIVFGSYYADSNVQAVEVPFSGGKMAVDFFLPASSGSTTPDPTTGLTALEAQMTSTNLSTWISGAKSSQVLLFLPKFKVDFAANLTPPFQSLGVSAAFDPGTADFSGIDGAMDLWISFIQHEAVLNVDEAGITAAAATAVGIAGNAAPENQETVNLNRPFTMVIRDVPTGTVLFVGQITNPAG